MIRVAVCALALALSGEASASAADVPLYQPQPAWVRPIPLPDDVQPSGAAGEMLLDSVQDRLAPGDDESFMEQAVRINAPEGLSQADKLTLTWNPLTDTLAIHRARLLRGGRVIDLLANGRKFTVLRRETNLEAATIDGELTATLQPEGVQVGDIVDLAYTVTRREPALAGHSEGGGFVGHAGTIGRLYVRTLWPAGKPFHSWKTDDLPPLIPVTRDGWTEIAIDQRNAVSPEPPKGAFPADRLFGLLEVSDFKDWAEVSATAYPLYAKAATLAPGSALNAEIARIKTTNPDAKGRALAALQLVEGQTRYLYVGLDAGGYTPAAADQTWVRRYGDCKGKTVLLLALLKGLGVEAEPALVHTTLGDALDREQPEMSVFDHVMVHATIDGRDYWLDGTRMADEDLDILNTPNDHWALPVRPQGASLVALRPTDPVLPMVDTVLKIDARSGVDKPAQVREEIVMRQDAGWAMNLAVRQASHTDRDRALRQMLVSQYNWVAPDKLDFAYDAKRMEARITLSGTGKVPFTASDGKLDGPRDWLVDASYIASSIDLTRTTDYHRKAPYQVAYPLSARSLVQVELPEGGKAFEALNDDPVSQTVAGRVYTRTAVVNGGRFVMFASTHAVAPSFPAAEAEAANATLQRLASYPVSLRYTPPKASAAVGGSSAKATAAEDGSSADKAAAAYLRKDYAAAEASFTAALAEAPSARLYYDRATARLALGAQVLARSDLDASLRLDPKHATSLYALGRLDLAHEDLKAAAQHFSAALDASGRSAKMVWSVATAYQNTGHFAAAVPYYDQLMVSDPLPASRDLLLNQRCWTRAQWGRELDRALADCDEALRLRPGETSYLDSRGLVELRSGAFDKSIRDYSSALTERPHLSSSLYGRGLAEAKLGKTAQADADFAAALQASSKVEAEFAKWGVRR